MYNLWLHLNLWHCNFKAMLFLLAEMVERQDARIRRARRCARGLGLSPSSRRFRDIPSISRRAELRTLCAQPSEVGFKAALHSKRTLPHPFAFDHFDTFRSLHALANKLHSKLAAPRGGLFRQPMCLQTP